MHTLVFDLSNIAYICAHRYGNGLELNPQAPTVVYKSFELMMRQMYRQFMPNHVIFACDHENYWRRKFYPEYKGNREDNLLRKIVRSAIADFKAKNVKLCMEHDGCEADDIIYGATRFLAGDITIVSTDRDFIQLMSNRVRLFDPKGRNYRAAPVHAKFDLFVKCIRGDAIDNIKAAYPRVTLKKLKQAYFNERLLNEIFAKVNKDGSIVKDNYEFNRKLIDLSQIPDDLLAQMELKFSKRFGQIGC